MDFIIIREERGVVWGGWVIVVAVVDPPLQSKVVERDPWYSFRLFPSLGAGVRVCLCLTFPSLSDV